MAGAAVFVETAIAEDFVRQSRGFAFLLTATSLMSGLIALFIPHRVFGRIFLYFIFGFSITFATFKFLEIDLWQWSLFTNYLGWTG
ncbi:MAG: hypothetical protein ACJASZ_001672 [Yoonia sp.]|jgi:hypothetical protein